MVGVSGQRIPAELAGNWAVKLTFRAWLAPVNLIRNQLIFGRVVAVFLEFLRASRLLGSTPEALGCAWGSE